MSTANANHWLGDSPIPASLNILGVNAGIFLGFVSSFYSWAIKPGIPSLAKLGAAHANNGNFVLNTLYIAALPLS